MSDLLEKCSVCQALVDEEDLFCANCGTEAPERVAANNETIDFTHNFECQGCGASMSYDASAQNLRCPFCGSERLEDRPNTVGLGPRRVVPFAIETAEANATLREWLGRGFWRPGDLSERAAITKMTAVFRSLLGVPSAIVYLLDGRLERDAVRRSWRLGSAGRRTPRKTIRAN